MSALAKEAVAPTRDRSWTLLDVHSADFLRLQRVLQSGRGFRLILCQFNAPRYRDRVISQVNAALKAPAVWTLPANPDAALFEAGLVEQGRGHDCLHLIGLDQWLAEDQESVLRLLNYHRERIVELAPLPLLLWVSPAQVAPFARQAPDMWAWRAAVLDFTLSAPAAPNRPIGPRLSLGRASADEMRRRIAEIREYLAERPRPTNADANLLVEAAAAAHRLADWTETQTCADQALKIYQAANNRRGMAMAQGRIADVLRAQGKLDEALCIRREQQLPIYDRLGDTQGRADTLEKIADILAARGEWDEALRIRRDEELPIYQELGNQYGQAVALSGIGEVLFKRGDLNEARRICQDQVLPLFEHLDRPLNCAMTLSNIAEIDKARGDFDKALHVLRDQVLPIFENLGDLRSRATALGQIADILEANGDLEEALRIYQRESLSTFAQLGDEISRATTLGRIAHILWKRGEFDDALRILRDEELPIYRDFGDFHGLLSCQVNIAIMLLARASDGVDGVPERAEAEALLCQSLAHARQLGIPAAIESIEGIIAKHGLRCTAT